MKFPNKVDRQQQWAQATFGLYVWKLYNQPLTATISPILVLLMSTSGLAKQIPARLQSQHCKHFAQNFIWLQLKKKLKIVPFSSSLCRSLFCHISTYLCIIVGIPRMTVYLTVYMSWAHSASTVCVHLSIAHTSRCPKVLKNTKKKDKRK